MTKMDSLQINCLVNPGCLLGEGPVWDAERQLLYWVDILDKKIYRYNPSDKSIDSWPSPEYVGFLIIRHDGSLIAGFKSGLHHINLNDNGEIHALRIDRVDEHVEHIRFNDGISDIQGHIWACTMDMRNQEPLGKYFCYDSDFNRIVVDEGYIVANGPAISLDGNLLYTVETIGNTLIEKGIYVSEINSFKKAKNKKLLISWSKYTSYPDGITTDAAGNLWIGEFGGNILRCFSPDGNVKYQIPLPALNITKATFGGVDKNILFVTTARLGVDAASLRKYPCTGGIIEITDFV
jgi:sugar lactone lactonase YvrE